MAASLTVLDWGDIRTLVELCTKTPSNRSESGNHGEANRLELVEAVLGFVRVWTPGAEIDNDARQPLVDALQRYFETPTALQRDSELSPEMLDRVKEIQQRLILAMEVAEADHRGPDDTGASALLLGLLLFLAAHGASVFVQA